MDYTEFINQIETGVLPRRQFNHIAHLKLALYHIFIEKDYGKALVKVGSSIKLHNAATERQTLLSPIYSETITQFWTKELFKLFDQNKNASLDELETLLLASELTRFDYIYGFYTKTLLESESSQVAFVEPDVKEE